MPVSLGPWAHRVPGHPVACSCSYRVEEKATTAMAARTACPQSTTSVLCIHHPALPAQGSKLASRTGKTNRAQRGTVTWPGPHGRSAGEPRLEPAALFKHCQYQCRRRASAGQREAWGTRRMGPGRRVGQAAAVRRLPPHSPCLSARCHQMATPHSYVSRRASGLTVTLYLNLSRDKGLLLPLVSQGKVPRAARPPHAWCHLPHSNSSRLGGWGDGRSCCPLGDAPRGFPLTKFPCG